MDVSSLIKKSTRDMSRNELSHHVCQLRELAIEAISDRQILADEVLLWRIENEYAKFIDGSSVVKLVSSDGSLTKIGAAFKKTDKSGVLQRAKEAK